MATISNVNGKKITKIKYKGEMYDVGGGVNPLQHIIDNHKGDNQPSGEDLFYEYWGSSLDDAINSCDFSKITSAYQMFYDCKNLTSVPYINASSCTTMERMFYQCYKLTTISGIDTSSCSNMSYMFYNCSILTTIPQIDTSKVANMSYMFYECKNLATIPQLDTSKVTNMKSMFYDCVALHTIDITHMKLTSPSYTDFFAGYCNSLTKLIIRNMDTVPPLSSEAFVQCSHFTGSVSHPSNPQGLKDGRIYVPDDKVEELKVATNWSVYADIIVPLSTLVE